jgi:hypothetical protein
MIIPKSTERLVRDSSWALKEHRILIKKDEIEKKRLEIKQIKKEIKEIRRGER